jgi:site-specific DNA-adenine methylase
MRTPITYYGGKQRIAPEIISMMPAHKIYVEPFFGGGAVFFRKRKAGIEVINDMDFDLPEMIRLIELCSPKQVQIGADTGHNSLPEPSKEKVLSLTDQLKSFTKVIHKPNLNRLLK